VSARSKRELIMGLPPDTPETLCSYLQWKIGAPVLLTDETDPPSIPDLARYLHAPEMKVRRALEIGYDAGIVDMVDLFNVGGKIIRLSRQANPSGESSGRRVGRIITPNWERITQLYGTRLLPVNRQTDALDCSGGTGNRLSTRRTGEDRKEMVAPDPVSQVGIITSDSPVAPAQNPVPAHASPADTSTVPICEQSKPADDIPHRLCAHIWDELNRLFHEAQEKQGVPEKKRRDLTYGRKDIATMKALIRKMEPRVIWTPYMRFLNLFSFWIERHPLKKMNTAMGVFKTQHEQWLRKLAEWEDEQLLMMQGSDTNDNAKLLRRLSQSPVAVEPPKVDPRIGQIRDAAYRLTYGSYFPEAKDVTRLLASYDVETIVEAMQVRGDVQDFFEVDGLADTTIRVRRQDAEKEQKKAQLVPK
jgi:hypothetical protein